MHIEHPWSGRRSAWNNLVDIHNQTETEDPSHYVLEVIVPATIAHGSFRKHSRRLASMYELRYKGEYKLFFSRLDTYSSWVSDFPFLFFYYGPSLGNRARFHKSVLNTRRGDNSKQGCFCNSWNVGRVTQNEGAKGGSDGEHEYEAKLLTRVFERSGSRLSPQCRSK